MGNHIQPAPLMCSFSSRRGPEGPDQGAPVSGAPKRLPSEGPGYVGSYATLVGFLRECRAKGCERLPEARFRLLVAAVEDLSRAGTGEGVNRDQELFSGDELNFMQVLPAMGIAVVQKANSEDAERDKSKAASHDGSDGEGGVLDPSTALSLCQLAFDSRAHGMDLKADAQTLLYGFTTPCDLLGRYDVRATVLASWIEAIAEQYNANAYHNWRHAIDVFQFSYMAITTGAAEKFFNFQDIFALLLACIAHDVGHLGTNNAFLVNTGHRLAVTYNDVSPLENMHSSVFFQTLEKPGLNFLGGMAAPSRATLRQKVIDAILATDMSKHFEFVDRFTARVSKEEANPFQVDTKNDRGRQKATKSDRRMLLQAFTHAADLGNCCRPWEVHKHIVVALEDEFFRQGDMERELGLPVMPLMDRRADSAATAQGFFLEKMVRPLMLPVTHFLTEELGERLLGTLAANKDRWAQLLERHGVHKASELVPLDSADADAPEEERPAGSGR